jgi:hypothetical protein
VCEVITIPVPHFDPVWLAAIGVALALAVLHLVFLPGYFRRHELPRPVTYVLGVLVIGAGFSLLYLFGRPALVDHLRPIADFWILAAAASVPSLGFRFLKRSIDDRAALEVLSSGDN